MATVLIAVLALACSRSGQQQSEASRDPAPPPAARPTVAPCHPIEVVVAGQTYYPAAVVSPVGAEATVTIIGADGTLTAFRKSQVTSVSTKSCPGRAVECTDVYRLPTAEGSYVTVIEDGRDDDGNYRWREVGADQFWLTDYLLTQDQQTGTFCQVE